MRLSSLYNEIRQLRSLGNSVAAIAKLRANPPATESDAFEAVVCMFVCGELEGALRLCLTHRWQSKWAVDITAALAHSLKGADEARAIALARRAVSVDGVPYDAFAIYLLLLQKNGLIDEAASFLRQRLSNIPANEIFLLTIAAEVALDMGSLREAYGFACTVHAAVQTDYRTLIVMSVVAFTIGNVHEALGHALAARMVHKGSLPAVLQIMRCQNRLGNFYATLGAFETLTDPSSGSADIHVELAKGYEGLGDRERAIAEYRTALSIDPQSAVSVRGLLGVYARGGYAADIDELKARYKQEIEGDYVCLSVLGIAALNRGDLEEAKRVFTRTAALAERTGDLPMPIPESRIRHDCEQLELLAQRGKLSEAGANALTLLRRYCAQGSDSNTAITASGTAAQALKAALTATFHVSEQPFTKPALGTNDYAAIENQYLADGMVIIDGFLSPTALEALRRYCEESTVWKASYQRGYVGAMLGRGFCPEVLLAIAHELKQALPRVIGDCMLLQAWAYKYDQKLQGINLHGDFAEVNVNFWIAPDEACVDQESGGMIVYDRRAPAHWTFHEYNNDAEKLDVYLKFHQARASKVPHRANRCVLFDSKFIHRTDDMHFKPGYENRRINVTLLYGERFAVS